MIITLCSSATFFDKLVPIKGSLESRNYEVFLPSMRDYHGLEETALAKIHYNLLREHFRKIDMSDAIYVANYAKNGIEGYIGGNTLLEIGKAFDNRIPIFLFDRIPNLSYREELVAMQPVIVGEDWDKLDTILREYYKK